MPVEWREFLGVATDQSELIELTDDLAAVVDPQSNSVVILRRNQPVASINTFGNGQNIGVAEMGKPNILIQQIDAGGSSVFRFVEGQSGREELLAYDEDGEIKERLPVDGHTMPNPSSKK